MTTKTISEIRSQFFFAEAEAGMYDASIDLVVPAYSSMHAMVLDIMRASKVTTKGHILDVGSGSGADSISILKAFPRSRVCSLDLCKPIQDQHQRKLESLGKKQPSLLRRATLIWGDILDYCSKMDALLERSGGELYSAVVSSLVIHHFSHAEKMRVYRLAHCLLKPGGVLINADLFAYRDPRVNGLANDFDRRWMTKHLLRPPDGFSEAKRLPIGVRKRLLRKWLRHYREFNRLESLEDNSRQGQVSMLRQIGFESVGVPYRFSLSGILVGYKK